MENNKLYMVNGEEVLVIRKNIKNMYLRIKDPEGPVELSIPKRMGTEGALDFVRTKLPWIRKKRQQLRESAFRAESAEMQYLTGEAVQVWGKEYLLEVREGQEGSDVGSGAGRSRKSRGANHFGVELSDGRAIRSVPSGAEASQRKAVLDFYLGKEMERYLRKRVPEIEAATGLHCDKWRIRAMTSRWGSCSMRTGIITINLNLAAMEKIYTDYVIIHELCHTKVPNHGKAFYAMMDRHMPGWREIRRRMR